MRLGLERISPNMEDGIASPGPPCLRHFFSPLCGNAAKIIAHGNILFREGIRPAQSSHRDIMRSPLADAGQFGQSLDCDVRIVMGASIEGQFAGDLRSRQSNDAFAPCAHNAKFRDFIDARPGNPRRCGSQAA